jgi:hypothetical protein
LEESIRTPIDAVVGRVLSPRTPKAQPVITLLPGPDSLMIPFVAPAKKLVNESP